MARRLVDAIALGFAGFGTFLLISLLSYHHADPSWNTAGTDMDGQAVQNLMGSPGAFHADLLMQTLGFGSYALAFGLCIWGVQVFRRRSLKIFALRCIALLFSGLFAALSLAAVPSGDLLVHPYLGSTVGTMLMNTLGNGLHSIGISWVTGFGYILVSLLSAVLFLGLFLYACAFTKDEIKRFTARTASIIAGIILLSLHMAGRFGDWLRHYNDPDHIQDNRRHMFEWPSFKFERKERTDSYEAPTKPKAKTAPVIERAANTAKVETPVQMQQPAPAAPKPSASSIPVVANSPSMDVKKSSGGMQQRFALNDGGEWEFPPLELLEEVPESATEPQLNEEALRKNAELLQNVLNDFKIEGEIVSIHPGPVVTLYEFEPAPGTKSSRIISLSDDIARSMAAISVRAAVVPGRNVIGIELPNKQRQFVYMREMLMSDVYTKTKAKLPLILGKDIGGKPILADLAKMPHLLVAGTTGSGKSVAVNTMILSLLYSLPPEKCRFIMIDPKMLELSVYDNIPHLLSPVVTEPGKAVVALKWTVAEMEERYRAMSKLGVRNIEGYNDRLAEARKKGDAKGSNRF